MDLVASEVLIALGSNLGDRDVNILRALEKIDSEGLSILSQASSYDSAPIGSADQRFINTAILCATSLAPQLILDKLLVIEECLGRIRKIHWGNRCIDLDIILWRKADKTPVLVSTPSLQIPHPRALERDFVMIPIAEIAGDWIFPGTKRSLKEICTDRKYTLTKKEPAT